MNSDNSTKLGNAGGRVLFIGNIANNAYNNAKILRAHGIEVDVLCHDYYHIMGCPEWEDADLKEVPTDQFYPSWSFSKSNSFKRPDWFYQGPMLACLDAIYQKNTKGKISFFTKIKIEISNFVCANGVTFSIARDLFRRTSAAKNDIRRLFFALASSIASALSIGSILLKAPFFLFEALAFLSLLTIRLTLKSDLTGIKWFSNHPILRNAIANLKTGGRYLLKTAKSLATGWWPRLHKSVSGSEFDKKFRHRVENLLIFAEENVDNTRPLKSADLFQYHSLIERWERVLRQYDKIVAFSTDGIFPLLCDVPYVAFEHGTIRNIPWAPNAQGVLCNLVYRKASHVIVTNCDNNIAADRLCPGRYTFVPHPINEWVPNPADVKALRKSLVGEHEKIIVFAPARHDWDEYKRDSDWEKGNDLLIKAAASKIQRGVNLLLIFVNFGRCVEKSKNLVKSLDIGSSVVWINPVHHRLLMQYLAASDLIADQFNNPSFGGIPGKAWLLERPVINAYDRKMHDWCFSEDHPPLIGCDASFESIALALDVVLDQNRLKEIGKKSKDWYLRQHSSPVIYDRFYRILFDGQ